MGPDSAYKVDPLGFSTHQLGCDDVLVQSILTLRECRRFGQACSGFTRLLVRLSDKSTVSGGCMARDRELCIPSVYNT